MALLVVADDDTDIREVLSRLLRRDGHTVIAADNGETALREILARPGVDAVVTDIDMPQMSGLELCRSIRADRERSCLPVILVSGSLMPGDQRPQQVQATALLPKPFRSAELLRCLRAALADGHEPGQAPCVCGKDAATI
ncbi:response regulator [Actinoplanes italicus]|uniref:Response regulator receiver domain-containing protein n=1 Tax=Actinoplanes italicus TaxID=113567 RepID=A0A2T0JXE8_9ACTN|nr:response regulator [Actinoplanes italicus]PRX12675.1 response regulator receiver domain-containing protein [Actinoplanes italicus]